MQICLIDFESTGVDVTTARITEIGAQMFRPGHTLEEKFPPQPFTSLVYEPDYPEITTEVEEVTGITKEMLLNAEMDFVEMVSGLVDHFQEVQGWPDYFLAHNKNYDEQLFKWEMKRHKAELMASPAGPFMQQLFDIPWLCSIEDIEHNPRFTCKKLSHLALDYGVQVDPTKLHRAMGDVGLLREWLVHAQIDFLKVIERTKTPWVIIRAMVPSPFGKDGDGGKGKDEAKKAGYGWQKAPRTDGPEFKNCWVKRVKENEIDQEREKLSGYEIRIVSKS